MNLTNALIDLSRNPGTPGRVAHWLCRMAFADFPAATPEQHFRARLFMACPESVAGSWRLVA